MSKKHSGFSSEFASHLLEASTKPIHLNIGGAIFTTSEPTLLRVDSIFREILLRSQEKLVEISPRTWFFDRDPRFFPLILSYFRTSVMQYPSDLADREALLIELHFYQVKDLIERSKFTCKGPEIQHGILYHLGLRGKYCFENPVDCQEIEAYMGEQFHCYLKSKLVELPLKHLFDFSQKISEDKPVYANKNAKEPYLIVRFLRVRVKPTRICLENLRESHLAVDPANLAFFGACSDNLKEIAKDKNAWTVIEAKFVGGKNLWKEFEVNCYESFNTIKIENMLVEQPKVVVSGIEIYGGLVEKN